MGKTLVKHEARYNLNSYKLKKVFISEKSVIVVQSVGQLNECDMHLVQTAEGLFLSKDKKALTLKKHNGSMNAEFNHLKILLQNTP